MRIVFGDAFDDGAWPGPLGDLAAGRSAVLDEVWVGPRGLTDVLAVRLGLLSLDPPRAAERAADLARRLRDAPLERPWSRSLAVDPLATARSLLRTRDALLDVGVDDGTAPAVLPPRLAALHDATRQSLPGHFDRTREVITALEGGARARVDVVAVVGDEAALSPLSQRLLRALERGGAAVAPLALRQPADQGNDLSRARRGDVGSFTGDGSLLLLRPDAAVDAADEIAALLVSQPALVIGADAGLDEALHRRDAGTLGIAGAAGDDALLALLPLVIAVGEGGVDGHPDPERLFELAALPLSPLPRDVAGNVRRALLKAPSARAPAVFQGLEIGLQRLQARVAQDLGDVAAQARLDRVRARLIELVPAWSTNAPVPTTTAAPALQTAVLLDRLAALLRWLQGRQTREWNDEERTPYRAAIRQVTLCRRLLLSLDVPVLTPPQLLRLLESATEGTRPLPRRDAEARHKKLNGPQSLCGPADVVVWWNFSTESARLPRSPFTIDEARALTAAGFAPPHNAARAKDHARAQRRPLDHTTGRLILCCPRRGDDGRELHPHPLWDELMARLPKAERRSAARALTRPDESFPGLVPRTTPVTTSLPTDRILWRIPAGSVQPKDVTSPSSEERLLSCAFRAVLFEKNVRPRPLRLPRGPQLEGQVVHALLARVLKQLCVEQAAGNKRSADDAADLVRACFDDVATESAGAWLRPGREQTRVRVRERAARAAAALVQLLDDNGYVISAVEEERGRELPSLAGAGVRTLKGTPDLVVDGPLGRLIIDHKTGNDRGRRELLAVGGAVQLVDYTVIAGDKGKPWPQAAYFLLRSRRLITTDHRIVGAEVIVGPRQKDAWELVDAARGRAFATLVAGEIEAPGGDGGPVGPLALVEQGRLRLAPPCALCPADVLCGRAFAVMRARARSAPVVAGAVTTGARS